MRERDQTPAPSPDTRTAWRYRLGVLAGAWLAVPALVAAGAALLTASLDCDTNGLGVIVAAALGGLAGGWAWTRARGAGGWLLAAAVAGACPFATFAGAAAWAAVALDRCFTF
jgi:hypothetical protein